ncbi:YdcF family protein [Corynebacterium sp. 3HC-13]|uniref:YdcF family protein n=1 Tax=Corynebacterium poyangense TaxID=2684405 RepID=UPI001CCE49D5|nr:YdcF family protein [Corynebacterium poyangense]MBZ8178440.1 YdcF family protein [Corynebacterium poyangense]
MAAKRLPISLGVLSLIPAVFVMNAARVLWHSRCRSHAPEVDAVIVPGTAQYDGVPGRYFAARLDHAAQRGLDNPQLEIWVIGGQLPGDRFSEAEAGVEHIRRSGVPLTRLRPCPHGFDTLGSYQHLVAEHPDLKEQKLAVITDPHHSLRACLLARECGLKVVADPTPYCPSTFPNKSWFRTLIHEIGGMVVVDCARVFGRPTARVCEDALRRLDGWLRPSHKTRHAQLKATGNSRGQD